MKCSQPFLCVHIRNGRPGVFLRELCFPSERRDDEPVLHIWCLPQVGPARRSVLSRSGTSERRRCVVIVLQYSTVKPLMSVNLSCFLPSGSRLGGIVTTMCFFFNHGEVSTLFTIRVRRLKRCRSVFQCKTLVQALNAKRQNEKRRVVNGDFKPLTSFLAGAFILHSASTHLPLCCLLQNKPQTLLFPRSITHFQTPNRVQSSQTSCT